MDELVKWQNYYVILGSAAAALVGVQFVVLTLIASMRAPTTSETVNAFGTPTVVHFSMTIVLSGLANVPWHSLLPLSWSLAACGAGGIVYATIVVARARRQTGYEPVLSDWLWFLVLPWASYAALLAAALLMGRDPYRALLVVGGVALMLLVAGIHNAWDTVTHLVVTNAAATPAKKPEKKRKSH